MYSAVRLMRKLYNIKHAKVHPFPSPPPKKNSEHNAEFYKYNRGQQ